MLASMPVQPAAPLDGAGLPGLSLDGAGLAPSQVRRFLEKGLDAWGPQGQDFLTVLGAHEGEVREGVGGCRGGEGGARVGPR